MQESSLLLYSALPSRSLSYAKLMKNVICGAVFATIKSSNMLYNIYLRVFYLFDVLYLVSKCGVENGCRPPRNGFVQLRVEGPANWEHAVMRNSQSNHKPLPAMSSSVSPRRRRYRGSGSIEPKGLTHSRVAAFLQV